MTSFFPLSLLSLHALFSRSPVSVEEGRSLEDESVTEICQEPEFPSPAAHVPGSILLAGWHRLPGGQGIVTCVPADPASVRLAQHFCSPAHKRNSRWYMEGPPADLGRPASLKACWRAFRSSGILEVKKGASSWEVGGDKTRPGAMRGGSRRCPQRPGVPLRRGDCESRKRPRLKMEFKSGHSAF